MTKPKKIVPFAIPLLLSFILLASGCAGALQSGALALLPDTVSNTATPGVPAPNVPAVIPPQYIAAQTGSLEEIYAQVSPSVVHIQVAQAVAELTSPHASSPDESEDLAEPDESDRLPQAYGEGSGFVWDSRGHIVTNNHVIDNAEKITVLFADDTIVPATLVGADPDSDLAVLKVDLPAGDLMPVQMGDSTALQVGQLAIAIGNPFGQEGTMTAGIVSALGRLLPVNNENPFAPRYNIPDVIQTDAAINPGNSGGVLLDDEGLVIGVTSAIISSGGASSGVGFAIPAAIVNQVVPALISDGHYEHPFLGISGGSLTPELAEAMDLPADQRGTLVSEVLPEGPAEEAGLLGSDEEVEIDGFPAPIGGDVIIAMDGQPIEGIEDIIAYLERHTQVGQTVELTILRDGKTEEQSVKLSARPKREDAPIAIAEEDNGERAWLGVLAMPLTAKAAEAMGLPADQSGILVTMVEQGSPADDAGLVGSYKPATSNGSQVVVGGDIIVGIDNTEITGLEDFYAVLKEAQAGDEITIILLRNGEQMQVDVTLAERPD